MPRGRPRGLLCEPIAGAPHRLDHVRALHRTERFAQALDVHVDRALLDEHVVTPDAVAVLSINSEGIYSIIYGRFDKKEILNLKLKVSEDSRVKLMVFLNNPENYLSRNSGLKKMLHEKIYKETGTPIVINVKGKYDLFDLETAVEKFNE